MGTSSNHSGLCCTNHSCSLQTSPCSLQARPLPASPRRIQARPCRRLQARPCCLQACPRCAYKPYVDQYADVPAVYTWEYAVQDDYTSNNFGAKEARDGYLTNGKYYVNLPDGRLQT